MNIGDKLLTLSIAVALCVIVAFGIGMVFGFYLSSITKE